jgi:phosphate transport system permease protein
MRLPPLITQRIAVALMWILAGVALSILAFIIVFIFYNGLPNLSWEFLTKEPRHMGREGGIFPMIVATAYITALGLSIASPIGLATAIYLTEYTEEGVIKNIIRFGADCLAGIPSIIFGLFGFVFFVITLGLGLSVISGALTLALMVLPTIIRTSEEAIRAVPQVYREVSFGLGSTKWQMITRVVLPSALPGIFTGIVLSAGRCISETAAVMLTAGSALSLPQSVFDSSRTLALHFYIMSREGISMQNAYQTAAILIIAILIINIFAYWLMRRFISRLSVS